MGGNFTHYIVTDRVSSPPCYRFAYSEHMLYMPHTYQVRDCCFAFRFAAMACSDLNFACVHRYQSIWRNTLCRRRFRGPPKLRTVSQVRQLHCCCVCCCACLSLTVPPRRAENKLCVLQLQSAVPYRPTHFGRMDAAAANRTEFGVSGLFVCQRTG